jgi:hypothetical protein
MLVTRKRFRLAAKWNHRERDLHVDCTPRFSNCDLRWLCDVFNKEVLDGLERRGYDLRTLRFSIDKTPEAIAEHERMAGR